MESDGGVEGKEQAGAGAGPRSLTSVSMSTDSTALEADTGQPVSHLLASRLSIVLVGTQHPGKAVMASVKIFLPEDFQLLAYLVF